ncbi:MAG: ImmA/IrrE family metallo-endopeptidase [Fimbriimonas sp.]
MSADSARAKRAALRLIDYFGITNSKDIDLELMAWHLGIDIRECRLKKSEAQLIRKGKVGLIRVRYGEATTPRGRFSIAHELGHWEMHPDGNQFWICTADQIHRYQGSAMEVEANAFASELLMPTPLFQPLCRQGTFGFRLADRLSSQFGTSLQATALRMVDETQEPAIVVLSDGERVCWSKRNQRKLPDFDFHIEKGRDLHCDTRAWSASLDGDSSGSVPARAWFPALKDARHYSVHEDVRYIEAYELALSLIVVHED